MKNKLVRSVWMSLNKPQYNPTPMFRSRSSLSPDYVSMCFEWAHKLAELPKSVEHIRLYISPTPTNKTVKVELPYDDIIGLRVEGRDTLPTACLWHFIKTHSTNGVAHVGIEYVVPGTRLPETGW